MSLGTTRVQFRCDHNSIGFKYNTSAVSTNTLEVAYGQFGDSHAEVNALFISDGICAPFIREQYKVTLNQTEAVQYSNEQVTACMVDILCWVLGLLHGEGKMVKLCFC